MTLGDNEKIQCEGCGAGYSWSEKYAGKKVQCKCGQVMQFPAEPPMKELELELNLDSGIDLELDDSAVDSAEVSEEKQALSTEGDLDLALNDASDSVTRCVNCQATLRPGAVLCVACGYNFQEGKKIESSVGQTSVSSASTAFSGPVYEGCADGFFGRFARSWRFAKISYGMLWDFKQLMLFPIFSAIAATLVFVSFLLPAWKLGMMPTQIFNTQTTQVVQVESAEASASTPTSVSKTASKTSSSQTPASATTGGNADSKNPGQIASAGQSSDASGNTESQADSPGGTLSVGQILFALAFYFCNYFVIVFFNTALIACAMKVVVGEVPTLGEGLKVAMKRLPQIVAWAMVSAVVGVILKALENTHEKAGTIIAMILGSAWTVLTYFVVPVIAVEGLGPFKAIKSSVTTLKGVWGETIVGNFSMGLLTFLIALPIFLILGVCLFVAVSMQNMMLCAAVCTLWIFSLVIIGVASSAADIIFKALLYHYALGKTLPASVDTDMFAAAFATPRQKGLFKK